MKSSIIGLLKNIPGWRTRRHLVVINVDDYGNVRLASKQARTKLEKCGVLKANSNRFDRFDALENRQDLEALFDVLSSVRDGNGNSAVFTAYALSANPDFRRILKEGAGYHYETLTDTFDRLSSEQPGAYEGAWSLWCEGIQRGLIRPQLHGREHFNVAMFEAKLARKDPVLMSNLEAQCMAGLTGEDKFPGVGFTQAFGVSDLSEIHEQKEILKDGLDLFRSVFGFRSLTFTPPAAQLHPSLYEALETRGIKGIHKARYRKYLTANSTGSFELNWLGKSTGQDHLSIVRNVVFEPTDERGYDPVDHALEQIAAAFRLRKPALISSHRVNFSGQIDPGNRKRGLSALKELLTRITQKWPDVEFISADALTTMMAR